MLQILLILFIALHGLLCGMGFVKAFDIATLPQLTQPISRVNGVLWLTSALLFLAAALALAIDGRLWWMLMVGAILLSQYLIVLSWDDAKFGTIANLILIFVAIAGYFAWSFERGYQHSVADALQGSSGASTRLLMESDLNHLPMPVQRYIAYVGAVGKPLVENFRLAFEGKIRSDSTAEWMPMKSEQHNVIQSGTRLFFLTAVMKHLPVAGFHSFATGKASMDIRLLSAFTVQYAVGAEMDTAETVTFFNDICVFAPGALVDTGISWETIDPLTVRAHFTKNGITIAATLLFNANGELINFYSDDRASGAGTKQSRRARWMTPVSNYRDIGGHRLSTHGEAIYRYAEGDFCYGVFNLKTIEYNLK